MRRVPIHAALLGVLIMAAGALSGCAQTSDAPPLSGRVDDETVAIGAPSLAAARPATVTALVRLGSAARLTSVPVEPGDRVTSGQVVAYLDDRELAAQVASASAALRVARSRVGVLGARIDDIDSARSTIRQNRREVSDTIGELTAMRADLVERLAGASAQLAQLRALQARLSRIPPGTPPSALPPGLPHPREVAAGIAGLQAGTRQMSAGIARIDAGLSKARAGQRKLADADATAADARDTLEGLQDVAGVATGVTAAAVGVARVRRDLAVLRSPVDGTVVSAARTGEAAVAGAPVVRIRPDAAPSITLYITEQQRAGVRLGQSASVYVDSRDGEVFSAMVTEIAVRAEYPPSWMTTSDTHMTRAFRVRVVLEDDTEWLAPGTPADVRLGPVSSADAARPTSTRRKAAHEPA